MTAPLCTGCGQPLPIFRWPCADCGHPRGYHAMTERAPRRVKACTVHQDGAKCECRQYAEAKS